MLSHVTSSRLSIKDLITMFQAFGVMCGLERTALATLALSALPAEIARDMRDNSRAVSRLSHSALLLSMVLSMGDRLPITHFGMYLSYILCIGNCIYIYKGCAGC